MTTMGEFNSSLLPPCNHPPFSPRREMGGDTPHPSPWKEWVFQTHSFASQWQILGRWVEGGWRGRGGRWCLRRNNRGTFLRLESRAEPHLARYFSGGHIHLSPIFLTCGFIDKDTNFLDVRAVISQRRACVPPPLVLCAGQIAAPQCDLLEVIFWTSVRWQLKNERLKMLLRQ